MSKRICSLTGKKSKKNLKWWNVEIPKRFLNYYKKYLRSSSKTKIFFAHSLIYHLDSLDINLRLAICHQLSRLMINFILSLTTMLHLNSAPSASPAKLISITGCRMTSARANLPIVLASSKSFYYSKINLHKRPDFSDFLANFLKRFFISTSKFRMSQNYAFFATRKCFSSTTC